MKVWYNEINPFAAQHLRNLISAGHIAPGVVDERSIEDVRPDELAGYTQCHFFAGVGVWSYALRLAGWPDDKPAWTGSCPCQPFSTAGKGAGFNDERHLWPSFQWLIQERRPPVIFGEQVASKAVEPWIDLVHADLEAMGYTFGCIPFPSAGVGAPHIRDRAFWVAHSELQQRSCRQSKFSNDNDTPGRDEDSAAITGLRGDMRMADMHSNGRNQEMGCITASGNERIIGDVRIIERQPTTGPVNGFWRDSDWLFCRDGKWRPVRSGTFPLADGIAASVGRMQPRLAAMGFSAADIRRILGKRNSTLAIAGRNRVGRLKGYGNAINAEAAKAFIECFMEFAQ